MTIVANLYTQSQVQAAIIRAQVGLLLISQKIASQFLYLNSYQYNLYKNIQYDLFCLLNTVDNELQYVDFNESPSAYEVSYYDLVGAMIEKTKYVDVAGKYGGALNPNYQPVFGVGVIIIPQYSPLILTKSEADLVDAGDGNYYLPFLDNSEVAIPSGRVPVSVTSNGVTFDFIFDETYSPPRIWGFANNLTQTIIVTVI